MKQKLFYLFVLLSAILIAGGGKAQAQVSQNVDATIPFQFHAGGADFPAGAYTIRSLNSADDSLMEIRSADGQKSALFETEQSDITAAMKDNELIFDHVGDNYFLSKIVDADAGTGAEVFDPDYSGKRQPAATTGQKHVHAFLHL
jgi:hypothetical protein